MLHFQIIFLVLPFFLARVEKFLTQVLDLLVVVNRFDDVVVLGALLAQFVPIAVLMVELFVLGAT